MLQDIKSSLRSGQRSKGRKWSVLEAFLTFISELREAVWVGKTGKLLREIVVFRVGWQDDDALLARGEAVSGEGEG